jgi:hypothetical protein
MDVANERERERGFVLRDARKRMFWWCWSTWPRIGVVWGRGEGAEGTRVQGDAAGRPTSARRLRFDRRRRAVSSLPLCARALLLPHTTNITTSRLSTLKPNTPFTDPRRPQRSERCTGRNKVTSTAKRWAGGGDHHQAPSARAPIRHQKAGHKAQRTRAAARPANHHRRRRSRCPQRRLLRPRGRRATPTSARPSTWRCCGAIVR